MAEIQSKKGKLSPKVDLTPMVDLGFLLISFFMLSTTMNKSNVMEIQMPFKSEATHITSPIKENTAMTILLGKENKVFYYEGLTASETVQPKLDTASTLNLANLRTAIQRKQATIKEMVKVGKLDVDDQLVVVLKSGNQSTVNDFVATIDELKINGVKIYSVADIAPIEASLIK